MELPQRLASLSPRNPREIAAAAMATQANVAALRVAWCRHTGQSAETHEVRTPSPGPVRESRNILIDRHIIKDYSLEEVMLRLRQVWGEFCALCWLFQHVDPQNPVDFTDAINSQTLHCPAHIAHKLDDVQKHLWRIKHEQRRRHDRDARRDPAFQTEDEIALMYDIRIYGESVLTCSDDALLSSACEHAGMLAALRWASDNRWEWEGPGIMDVTVSVDSIQPVN